MSDRIYVVMIDDRHTDTDCELFTTPEAAIERAEAIVREFGGSQDAPVAGWLYNGSWSTEGDSVWVVEKPLIAPGP